jgi:hypothetical protein
MQVTQTIVGVCLVMFCGLSIFFWIAKKIAKAIITAIIVIALMIYASRSLDGKPRALNSAGPGSLKSGLVHVAG